jgi:hypothetical protein
VARGARTPCRTGPARVRAYSGAAGRSLSAPPGLPPRPRSGQTALREGPWRRNRRAPASLRWPPAGVHPYRHGGFRRAHRTPPAARRPASGAPAAAAAVAGSRPGPSPRGAGMVPNHAGPNGRSRAEPCRRAPHCAGGALPGAEAARHPLAWRRAGGCGAVRAQHRGRPHRRRLGEGKGADHQPRCDQLVAQDAILVPMRGIGCNVDR